LNQGTPLTGEKKKRYDGTNPQSDGYHAIGEESALEKAKALAARAKNAASQAMDRLKEKLNN
jgi:hypothetical protein